MNYYDYYTIGEVVQKLQRDFDDLSVSKLRHLEDEGLVTPQRSAGGYRMYSRDDFKRIELILRLQRDKGIRLAFIKAMLEEYDRGLIPSDIAEILQSDTVTKEENTRKTTDHSAGYAVGQKASVPGAVGPDGDPDSVLDPQRYDIAQDETPIVAVSDMMRDEKIPENFFVELKRYGILSPAAGSGSLTHTRLSAADAACVRAAWALRSMGIEPRHLRMYATFADKEADMYELLLRPTFRHKTPRSKEMLAAAAADIARQSELLRRCLLQRELRNKLEDLL
ncbi:MAG: MerR family transcriptional regulator [Coriobacteriia bacterium]|nr:MerR family transcriptional regulator [Coriobacteriia bacterium]MCL2537432.1 MerR family transcriptional regulator [Coriobacteriia bacterium]